MTLFCYLLAIGLNLFWFTLRGVLPFGMQMTIPVFTVVLLGVGAWARLVHLNGK